MILRTQKLYEYQGNGNRGQSADQNYFVVIALHICGWVREAGGVATMNNVWNLVFSAMSKLSEEMKLNERKKYKNLWKIP